MMETRYVAVYRLPGIIGLPDGADVEILPRDGSDVRVILTLQRDPYLQHLKRRAAFGMMLLSAFVGGQPGGDVHSRFQAALAQAKLQDAPEANDLLLIVEAFGMVETPSLDHRIDIDDFGFGLQVFDASALTERAREALEVAFAALSLALPVHATATFRKVGDVAYLIETETERPLYTGNISMSGQMTASIHADKRIIDEATTYARNIRKNAAFASVVRLLSYASDASSDRLKSFLAASTGLEIFVNKTFKDPYEPRMHQMLAGALPPSAARVAGRVRDVMKDKYNILDKFVAVASILDEADADADIAVFKSIKENRDDFTHAMRTDPTQLPAENTRDLLRKYLRLHLGANL